MLHVHLLKNILRGPWRPWLAWLAVPGPLTSTLSVSGDSAPWVQVAGGFLYFVTFLLTFLY